MSPLAWYLLATPPPELGIALDPAFEALLMRCLEKAPEDRPQDAAELARLLDELPQLEWDEAPAAAWWRCFPQASRRFPGSVAAFRVSRCLSRPLVASAGPSADRGSRPWSAAVMDQAMNEPIMLAGRTVTALRSPRSARLRTMLALLLLSPAVIACGDTPNGSTLPESPLVPAERHASCAEDNDIAIPTPPEQQAFLAEGFDRMVEIVAPNGKPIRIFAQDQISDLQLRRARNLLRFFLTPVPGTRYGADKEAVANAMADSNARLMMPNGAHEEGNEPPLNAQPLYWSETPVEGSAWYMQNDWEHRDAGFEEIFHLLHDFGIGTFLPGALPDYQAELLAEAELAIADGRWGIGQPDWIAELAAENSLAQEYIAAVIDSYYGLWGAWEETSGGMWGIYLAKDRAQMASIDPAGQALLEAFLPPMLDGYEARLDPDLEGTFSMSFDAALPYTHKSQYLVQVVLTGEHDVQLIGNAADNVLRGNVGDNVIEGGQGYDTAVYCSPAADYTVVEGADGVVEISGPDGIDQLSGIERLHFADGIMEVGG